MTEEVGISGFAVYVPPYRVNLESWCRWTNNVWDKTRAVVGHSFRMRGPAQSVYRPPILEHSREFGAHL